MEEYICRTCFDNISPEDSIKVEMNETELITSSYYHMLTYCVPELNLYAVDNPVLCKPCCELLKLTFDFKRKCMRGEDQISNYCYHKMIESGESDPDVKVKLSLVKKQYNDLYNINNDIEKDVKQVELVDERPKQGVVKKVHIFNDTVIGGDSKKTMPASCKGCLTSSIDPVDHCRVATETYSCLNCAKSYIDVMKFRKHMACHIRKNLCPLCNKGFRSPATLEIHMRSHTGEKPFKCQFCSKAFQQYYTHLQHEKNHLQDESLICQICQRKFSTKFNLQVHQNGDSCIIGKRRRKRKKRLPKFEELLEPDSDVNLQQSPDFIDVVTMENQMLDVKEEYIVKYPETDHIKVET